MSVETDSAPWWQGWDLSYTDNTFGPVYGGHSVQEAYYQTLQKWLPTYIAEVNRKIGTEVLEVPFEYHFRPDYRTLPRTAKCALLCVVDGTTGHPDRTNNGTRATWGADISCFVFGTQDWQETQALTYAYAATIRACIAQHPDLGGLAETTLWMGEKYMEGEHSSTRTTGLSIVHFESTLASAVDAFGGPPFPQYAATGANTGPSILPPSPEPIIATEHTSVTKLH